MQMEAEVKRTPNQRGGKGKFGGRGWPGSVWEAQDQVTTLLSLKEPLSPLPSKTEVPCPHQPMLREATGRAEREAREDSCLYTDSISPGGFSELPGDSEKEEMQISPPASCKPRCLSLSRMLCSEMQA